MHPLPEIDFDAAFGRAAPLSLEIGFGNGERLAQAAGRHPEINHIGAEVHRPGVGRVLLTEVERRLRRLGCPKVNVQVRSGNEAVAAFYRRLGYAEDGAVGLGKRLIPDA